LIKQQVEVQVLEIGESQLTDSPYYIIYLLVHSLF
jgi:hypothetical protein